jgi:hypothetical protein
MKREPMQRRRCLHAPILVVESVVYERVEELRDIGGVTPRRARRAL